jgi:glycosyltransferase involved in cell wall biosynthesis
MKARGHVVELWYPSPQFYKLPVPAKLKKWMGYIDQYIVFPLIVKRRLKKYSDQVLFAFTDHALGPWVPLVVGKRHIVHCHDFLAQQSAFGIIPYNPTGWSGKKYQSYIKKGYKQANNFISVSYKTQSDLHTFLNCTPRISEVVYNGLTRAFIPLNKKDVRSQLSVEIGIGLAEGYILHVGGNQWYKNRKGVIELYSEWRRISNKNLPLIMVGAVANSGLLDSYNKSAYQKDIHLLYGKSDGFLQKAYAGASLFLFPSLAEGFGWPIAEAMASGCPVITTNVAPMNEVGGTAAFYINQKPDVNEQIPDWLNKSVETMDKVMQLSEEELNIYIMAGFSNARRFDSEVALDLIENIYKRIS